jgi:outer membrane lipoprotein carrier protein
MRPKYFFVVPVLLLFVVISAVQAAETGGQIAERLQQAYSAIETFQADFYQDMKHRESGAVERYTGTISFKKPMLLRWEIFEPSRELILLTEEAAWQYFADEAHAYKYEPDLASESGLLFRVLTGQSRLDQEFDIASIVLDGEFTKVGAYPKEPLPNMIEARIWINPASGYVERVLTLDFFGNSTEVVLNNIRINQDLAAGLFTFTPPEGVLVEDNTGLPR